MSQKGQPKQFKQSLPNHNVSPYTLGKFIDTFNAKQSPQENNLITIYNPRDLSDLIRKNEEDTAWLERERQFMPGY